MKRKTEALLFAVGLATAACSTDTDLSDRPLFNGNSVLTLRLVDAVDGTTLSGDVTLTVGVHTLTADAQGNGYYVIDHIPSGTFPIMATAAGHRAFANTITLNGGLNYTSRNLIMFPTANVSTPINVTVYDTDGAPLAGATVVAQLTGAAGVIEATNDLYPDTGLVPSALRATSGTNGVATITATDLFYGGTYTVNVFNAVDGDGNYLVVPGTTDITVGDDLMDIAYYMALPPTTITARLVNNEDGGHYPTLVVTFPYAMELCTDAADATWSNTTSSHGAYQDNNGGTPITAAPADTNPVTPTFSANNTVLTLAYVAGTGDNADDTGDSLYVTFDDISVAPLGSSTCTALDNIEIRNTNGDIDLEIWVREVEAP
ncbi:MAG: hypothetical protein AAB426_01250 [Myxococcota bacterium]